MKKFTIQNISFIVNNKDKINILCFENKDNKYILYSNNSLSDNSDEMIDNNIFIKFEFNEIFQIMPKKRMNELFFTITTNNNIHTLLWNNNPVYYLKNSKNIIINNNILKLILSNGLLFHKEKNIIDDILQNKKNINQNDNIDIFKSIHFSTNVDNNINIKKIDHLIPIHNEKDDNSTSDLAEDKNDEKNNQVNSTSDLAEDKNDEKNDQDNSTSDLAEDKNHQDNSTSDLLEEKNDQNNYTSDLVEEKNDQNNYTSDLLEEKNDQNNYTFHLVEKINNEVNSTSNLEKIKNITNIINEEKIDLSNKKTEIENNVFNLENVLMDFNKLFQSIHQKDTQSINTVSINAQSKDMSLINASLKDTLSINAQSKDMLSKDTSSINTVSKDMQLKDIKKIHKYYTSKIQYLNIFYKLITIKLEYSNELNFLNLYQSSIMENNIINKSNISFELNNNNSSYLILFFNQKYLINKVNHTIILTSLSNKKSQVIKNKENFKLGNYDYMLYNDGCILIPMMNKKIYDNNYGTSYNLYIPYSIKI